MLFMSLSQESLMAIQVRHIFFLRRTSHKRSIQIKEWFIYFLWIFHNFLTHTSVFLLIHLRRNDM
jgi:hypothetical protein